MSFVSCLLPPLSSTEPFSSVVASINFGLALANRRRCWSRTWETHCSTNGIDPLGAGRPAKKCFDNRWMVAANVGSTLIPSPLARSSNTYCKRSISNVGDSGSTLTMGNRSMNAGRCRWQKSNCMGVDSQMTLSCPDRK